MGSRRTGKPGMPEKRTYSLRSEAYGSPDPLDVSSSVLPELPVVDCETDEGRDRQSSDKHRQETKLSERRVSMLGFQKS